MPLIRTGPCGKGAVVMAGSSEDGNGGNVSDISPLIVKRGS